MSDIRTKALGYLRDEKVRILGANWSKPELRPYRVSALVKGFHGLYWVRLNDQGWLCSCGTTDDCAHLAAVQMVTGYQSKASKNAAEMAASAS